MMRNSIFEEQMNHEERVTLLRRDFNYFKALHVKENEGQFKQLWIDLLFNTVLSALTASSIIKLKEAAKEQPAPISQNINNLRYEILGRRRALDGSNTVELLETIFNGWEKEQSTHG